MRKLKRISLSAFITNRIILCMLLLIGSVGIFITYFSNEAIRYDIKNQMMKESRHDHARITIHGNKIEVASDFIYADDGIKKIILNDKGEVISGTYSHQEFNNVPIVKRKLQKIKVGSTNYYVYDRDILKKDLDSNERKILYIRTIVSIKDISSQYRTLKYISYGFLTLLMILVLLIISITVKHITAPLKQICVTAEQIGAEQDLSKRVEYDGRFEEIDILSNANNRMLDRLEDMFNKQKQFTSDVAHELRTPVSVIMAQCQYARKHLSDREDYTEALDVIERQVNKTNKIILQLLQLSRLDQERIQIDYEYVDLKDIIEAVCENEKIRDNKNITIETHLDEIHALVDVNLMMIAIRNIVSNAMKYSYDNNKIIVTLTEEKDNIKICVEDFGCGIKKEEGKNIFDRFYRADKSRNTEGYGLGLSITHKIIDMHHGHIEVTSVEEQGSTFSILLPLM